ncbi:IS110 family transposase [Pseudomonas chlororaphis]|uniref:IS110 family transposase n=1 Tax=Pseudomonas chlororaphis TaxID=587753 RepID=UPI00236726EC|nr:IS110 family transposase [Pseudomonas chlororaphis]WDH19988.1 IS110 family transposase [Pseudomonas chlororaphis]WDH24434.1 IS110 family transposase [Pseudomonas chlororaphis]
MKLMRVGVDLAKNVFQIHGVDCHEQPIWRQRLPRERWLQTMLEKIEPGCEIGMESCGGAHHWARQLQARGFRVKLIAPQFVKPYVKSNKNDANDTEAICEAMSRPCMRFVAIKTVEQQVIQATHRIRAGLVEQRTAKANQIRGLVAEFGLVTPKELLILRRAIPCWLEQAGNGLTERLRRLLAGLWDDLRTLDQRVSELDDEISAIATNDPAAVRLRQLRGVGPMIATALLATLGDARQFANGRQFAASLGLTPRQHSSGGKDRLLGISKRGDAYLRTLLIHGTRAVLRTANSKEDPLSRWATRLAERSHPNVAAIALANKMARMAWAMLRNGTHYQPERAAA